ncbi:hemerythrin domain-containing protein [Streptomyces sp. 4N509B]|uniref:hemerythrin domain-containing protein n=1 Tax=Streptomyces sp. 4N509B TaxID=3457413 RepID=UPI003FD5C670
MTDDQQQPGGQPEGGPEEPFDQAAFDRAAGEKVLAAHEEFRAHIATIRAQLDAKDGEVPVLTLTEQLRKRCLDFCWGLGHHHGMEDGSFSMLFDGRFPHLAPVIERLRQEHRVVEEKLARFKAFLEDGNEHDAARVREELELAVDGMEEHFVYEEEHLLPALGVTAPSRSS